nr:YhgE/Pip domain-containing protein [uncultured Bacillus sp.]
MKDSLFLSEWKLIFQNKKILIPILAVICVPILYAGMFLWAFWDPYAHLDDLPVAVVNQDKGAEYNSETLKLGNQLIDNLKENETFQFHFVSKSEGEQGLENQKYYMLIEIPEDFSENATTLLDEQPKKLTLQYIPNESYNFLSSQIGETAAKEIKSAVAKEVTATYAETMFDKVQEMADGLGKAGDGAGQIDDGAVKLEEGSHTLKDNLKVLAEKSIEFNNGVLQAQSGSSTLAEGTSEFKNGVNQLTDGSGKLFAASKELQNGSQQLADGVVKSNKVLQEMDEKLPTLVAGTSQVKDGLAQFQSELPGKMAGAIDQQIQPKTGQLSADLAEQISKQQSAQMTQIFGMLQGQVDPAVLESIQKQLVEQTPSKENLQLQLQQSINEEMSGLSNDLEQQIQSATAPTFNQLMAGLTTIHDNQAALQNGVHQLADGSTQLNKGAQRIMEGQNEYVNNYQFFNQKLNEAGIGAGKLAEGANQLNSGMEQISDGSSQMSGGAGKLANGSDELAEGTVQLEDGINELKEKLGNAADQASSVSADDDTYNMMGDPVTLDKNPINKVPNYGIGFTPYFLSLGLFVGALLVTIVYHLKMPAIKPKNGFTWFMSKFGVIAIVGIIQALLADVILLFGLKIDVQSVPLFIMTSIVISITFMALIQFFVTLFANAGRFVAIVILIMQLTTSAGTFPLELIPKVLQPINAVLPMTYTVQALKAVISSGDFSYMWHNIGILMLYIIGFSVLTIGYFVFSYKHSYQEKEIQGEHVVV